LIVNDQIVEARQIILAPGSSPIIPEPWKALKDHILTTDTLFEEQDLPPRIAVIGLGAIGVEMAQALARLGIEVYSFDGSDKMAGISDQKVAEALRQSLASEFAIHLETDVDLVDADGSVEIKWRKGSVLVDKVLVAVGRRQNVHNLGLETLGVPLDDDGLPKTDPRTMRIGKTSVLLAGDGNAVRPLLHEGSDEGHIAGINALSETPVYLDRRTPMSITFCTPQVASVGQQADALDLGACVIGEVDFGSQGRARLMQQDTGLLRIFAARENGRLLGAEMAAPAGEHLAHLLVLAIDQDLTVHDLLRIPFYHPTLEEGLRTALREIARALPACGISDLAGCPPLDVMALE
jgi:dihydrolipoamide dehydrogenase